MDGKNKELIKVESTRRWWELYIIRYGLGTVLGAIFVYLIIDIIENKYQLPLKSMLLMMPPITEDQIDVLTRACIDTSSSQACIMQVQMAQDLYGFNGVQLVLLGVYGLAYTYFASAPALVVHATRFNSYIMENDGEYRNFVKNNKDRKISEKPYFIFFSIYFSKLKYEITSIIFILLIAVLLVVFIKFDFKLVNWGVFVLVSSGLYILYQVVDMTWSINNSKFILKKYKELHEARKSGAIDTHSYKDLREHGNAFFLILHSFLFYLLVISLSMFDSYYQFVFLLFWVFPAAMVYFLGHELEGQLIGIPKKSIFLLKK